MSVMFILIGVSLVVAIGFLVAFLWSVRSGQYRDDVTPAYRIILDEFRPESLETDSKSTQSQPDTTHAS